MKKEAILHVPLSQYAYSIAEDMLTIRIRTAKNDIKECMLFYGDRVAETEPIPVEALKMKRWVSDELFDYYEITFRTSYTRVCYYFRLKTDDEVQYYYSRGFVDQMDAHRTEYFQFPYIRREEVARVPEWVNDSVMYHIFPDSFASARKRIDEKIVGVKTAESVCHSKNGGTITGITENLDYLEDLGVNLIYLNPIFKANSYHKYDTIDYFDIDPCFGTKDDFKRLVDDIHARGMRIILDGVFNHCGPDFFAFKDVLANGQESRYADWFYKLNFPIEYQTPPNYECFAYVKEMPKLNTSNDEVRKYICEVGRYWIREFGIDGWRLDVANEIDHDTWRMFRSEVRKEREDAFLIAEIWEDAEVWLRGDQFDSAMNYTFTYLCRDFFAEHKISVEEFDQQIQKSMMRYPWPITAAQMNLLDSHDVPRFLYYCNGDVSKMRLAFLYLMTAPGVPSVFYGDECLISGETEDTYRAPMKWDETGNSFAGYLKQLIAIRKQHKALTYGKYESIYAADDIYIFARSYEAETIYVIINNSNSEKEIDLSKILNNDERRKNLLTKAGVGQCIKVNAVDGAIVM